MDFIRWATGTTDAEMAAVPTSVRVLGGIVAVLFLAAAVARGWRS